MSNSEIAEAIFVAAMMILIVVVSATAFFFFIRQYRCEMRDKEEAKRQKAEQQQRAKSDSGK